MLIAGAGGFAREILELLLQKGPIDSVYFYDDVNPARLIIYDCYQVVKSLEEAENIFISQPHFCLGVGDGLQRKTFYKSFISKNGKPASVISPFAHLGKNSIHLGEAVSIATGSVLTTNINVGDGCVVNLNCTIGHDSIIGAFTTLSPGVHISGNCSIGEFCMLGTGAVILPGITIGDHVSIGAGAVVTKNIESNITVAGIPATDIKNHKRL
jgi:sugar O-acyltransferase (sialic acid O-acetyltransferase NeuD family)